MDFRELVRDIKDFPSEGIIFRDITPVLHDANALEAAVKAIADTLSDIDFDYIAGPESRGFIFGVPVALFLKKGFIPVRKAGKLPYKTVSRSYDLEYGSAVVEIHADSIKKGDKVVIVDDLLATGGTCEAICKLIEDCGGEVVSLSFLIELCELKGRERLPKTAISSVLKY